MQIKDQILELLDELLTSKRKLAKDLIEKGVEASPDESLDSLLEKAGAYVPKTYVIVDEDGYEIHAALVAQETIFDATDNDVRAGKVYLNDNGPSTGTKVIPSYHTEVGYTLIPSGSTFTISFIDDRYDYTKLQAIICSFNGNVKGSVSADRVVINDGVYAVNSTELITTVTKNSENKIIDLGITNDSGYLYLLRYFTYKEIY